MAGTPVTSCARMTVPIPSFSADHEAPGSFPTVTTFSATSTWATPGSVNNRSARGEPAANSLAWKKEGPPGCTVRLTVNLHCVGIGDGGLGADRDRRVDRQDIRHLPRPWLRRAQRRPAGA